MMSNLFAMTSSGGVRRIFNMVPSVNASHIDKGRGRDITHFSFNGKLLSELSFLNISPESWRSFPYSLTQRWEKSATDIFRGKKQKHKGQKQKEGCLGCTWQGIKEYSSYLKQAVSGGTARCHR